MRSTDLIKGFLAEGIEKEGYNLDDFMVMSEGRNNIDGSPSIKAAAVERNAHC